MITSLELVDTSITSHDCPLFFVIRTFKIWSFSSFQVFDTVEVAMMAIYASSPQNLLIF